MKKAFFFGMMICAIGMFTACDEQSLGDGYYFIQDYPSCVGKKVAAGSYSIVLPPSSQQDDIAVNVFWDDTTVLAVCCYNCCYQYNLYTKDTTCWKLNKKTGLVEEITPDDFQYRTNQGKMRHSYVLRRYKYLNK
jgi:hypothetical protein